MKVIYKLFIIMLIPVFAIAQVEPPKFQISFTDKNNTPYSIDRPYEFLSTRAIVRRQNQDIPIIENDLPVDPSYIDSLESVGAVILHSSKWFNSVTCALNNEDWVSEIEKFSFVKVVRKIKPLMWKKKSKSINSKFENLLVDKNIDSFIVSDPYYGMAINQIDMLRGQLLHNLGFRGEGIYIAIIDAGFYNVDIFSSFDSLHANNQILGTKDFVDGGTSVFDDHTHGMSVLSIIAGNKPSELIGTAPKASFWLLRSEDVGSEHSIEEDNWIAAAEFADSVGVDIINSSLGYSTFDDLKNYTYSDMDGNTARVTVGADIAASKGIIVVSSAGNEGNNSWKYITAPADGDSVLCVGAVDSFEDYIYFSSTGPTADNRIKPDITAKGYLVAVQLVDDSIGLGSGTSFSAPVITGMVACLWQAHPELNNMEIIDAIRKSADQYYSPDSLKGYGVPDFFLAHTSSDYMRNDNTQINVFPNPFSEKLNIDIFSNDNNNVSVSISDLMGRSVYSNSYSHSLTAINQLIITQLSQLSRGVYILKITTPAKVFKTKIVKQ